MGADRSHWDQKGHARMVDITGKPVTHRRAVAQGRITLSSETAEAIRQNQIAKGEVFAVARVAAIQAAKHTPELIPLCHPLPLTCTEVDLTFAPGDQPNREAVEITSTVTTQAQTGVEMEALTAVAVAALTIYDMCKGIDRTLRIESIELLEKRGGKSYWRKAR